MRTIAAIAIFFISSALTAQIAVSIQDAATDSNNVSAEIIYNLSAGSGSLDNHFISSFYMGHYLSRDLRENTLNNLLPNNRLGAGTGAALLFGQRVRSFLDKQLYHTDLVIGLVDRMDLDAQFKNQFFELAMFGNREMAESDDTLHLGPFYLRSMRYQKMMVGALSDNGLGRRIGLTVSLVKGEQFSQYKMDRFNLYVPYRYYDPDLNIGESLYLDAQMTAQSSNPDHSGINAWNGTGMALDLFYERSYGTHSKSGTGSGVLQLEVSDLGFIVWNPNSTLTEVDTTLNFSGIAFDGLQDIGDSAVYDAFNDYTPDAFLDTIRQSNTVMLPVHAEMRIIQNYERQSLKFIISYKNVRSYTPLLHIEDVFKIGTHFRVGANIGYGGYTTFRGGLSLGYESARFSAFAGTSSIPGFIAYNHLGSISSYITMNIKI